MQAPAVRRTEVLTLVPPHRVWPMIQTESRAALRPGGGGEGEGCLCGMFAERQGSILSPSFAFSSASGPMISGAGLSCGSALAVCLLASSPLRGTPAAENPRGCAGHPWRCLFSNATLPIFEARTVWNVALRGLMRRRGR
jgi:hypothetical protein